MIRPGVFRVYWLVAVGAMAGAVALALVALAATARVGVVGVSPADGAQGVPMTAPLRITFSQPMDPASVQAHLRFEPDVRGNLTVAGKEAVFWPQPGLSPSAVYTATLEPGALSQKGRPLKASRTWRFRTRAAQLLYLGRPTPDAEFRQLYLVPLDGGRPRPLTDHPGGVWDYTVHPQGDAIAYSVQRDDGGTDLWRMDRDGANQRLLLGCPGAACLNPAWSPDGRQLAYERRDLYADAPNLDPSAGRIWLLDLERLRERPLFDYDVALHSPVWSPDGGRLAYVSPTLPGVEVYDLRTEELQQFANQWGAAPAWSPDGPRLAVPDLLLAGEELVVRLMRLDLDTEAVVDISGDDDLVKDVAPAWSPGGGWIAYGRQFLDEARGTPGRQIWLTRPDASESYGLPAEPMVDHWSFVWRPDGEVLAYARSDLSEGLQPVPAVDVWLFDFRLGAAAFVAADGVLPKWLP